MEKTITLSLAEYEEILKTVKKQQEAITEFTKDSRIILLDNRRNYHSRYLNVTIPRVIGDIELIKECLQGDFEDLRKLLFELEAQISKKDVRLTIPKPASKKGFWASIFNS